jgi:glycosyltransferase domain-containing protein
MKKNNNIITILLTLWDREIYSQNWIEENIFDDFDYIIADGSKKESNRIIFKCLENKENIKYVRYPFDANVEDYIRKITDAVSQVETPYVMICDNDDFLNYKGIIKCIEVLEINTDYGFSHGTIRGISKIKGDREGKNQRYKIHDYKLDVLSVDGLTGIDAIKKSLVPYSYVWYGVYRTEVYKKIWNILDSSSIKNLYLIEIFQSHLAFTYAKLKAVKYTHYIRLQDPVSSSAKQSNDNCFPDHHRIYFDENYRKQVYEICATISTLLKVDINEIYDRYRNFYTSRDRLPRIRTQIIKKIKNYFEKFVSIPLPLNILKKIL